MLELARSKAGLALGEVWDGLRTDVRGGCVGSAVSRLDTGWTRTHAQLTSLRCREEEAAQPSVCVSHSSNSGGL